MLRVTDISVSLGRTSILHRLSLSAQAGEVTCIVGRNGSGKTTALRAMTGDIPFDGEITLNDRDLRRLKPWEAAALRGVLPQASTLAFPFTVIEVVRIGLTTGSGAQDSAAAMQALARVGLAAYANRFYSDLSGGEQQRVQLARVLAQIPHPVGEDGPRWLFLDEPVASLDIAHQLQVVDIATRFAAAGGGVVAVMHDLNLTAMFADHIVLLSEGGVLVAGSPDAVLQDQHLSAAYGCALRVGQPPVDNTPFVLPQAARRVSPPGAR